LTCLGFLVNEFSERGNLNQGVKMPEKIKTLHPDPDKKGVNIDKQKYDVVRKKIIQILEEEKEIAFFDLMNEVENKLKGHFEGSIGWYYTTVKLDLEARGILTRIPGSRPQRLRLTIKNKSK
jgi:hypothetical protein